jgi:hypothetical protein
MKNVKVVLRFEFEIDEEMDKESLKQEIEEVIEELIENEELMNKVKIVITDLEDDDESYEDED